MKSAVGLFLFVDSVYLMPEVQFLLFYAKRQKENNKIIL